MHVYVEGVKIELTSEQILLIEKDKRARARCRNNFVKILKHFGFKENKKDAPGTYGHPIYEWYAEITVHNANWSSCWVVGKGLKDCGFPGGCIYEEAQELGEELARAITEILNT